MQVDRTTIHAWSLASSEQYDELSPGSSAKLKLRNDDIREQFADEFDQLVSTSKDGNVHRATLENQFGKLTDDEWNAFDVDHVTPITR